MLGNSKWLDADPNLFRTIVKFMFAWFTRAEFSLDSHTELNLFEYMNEWRNVNYAHQYQPIIIY